MKKTAPSTARLLYLVCSACMILLLASTQLSGQGVTTSSLGGIVASDKQESLVGASVFALHEPSGTRYGASTRANGQYNILNMRVGGPYTVTVSYLGHKKETRSGIFLSLGQEARQDFRLIEVTVQGEEVVVTGRQDDVMNSGRTGAATFITPAQVTELPSIKRSTRDLTRLDPRSDGNFSFGGKNWLFNNISLDGSYFNNPFGLDDPAPGGQANAEPFSFDAVEQVQVSVAPFDVREGGFTGAGINTVTKSGTNEYRGSLYSYIRNESLLGNKVDGKEVFARPDLSFNQSGFTVSGPIIPNTLFLFLNGELDRREDPGTNFVATTGTTGLGISRVRAATMDSIRQRMIAVYGYDPGPYQGYIHETNSEKLLLKLDWNISDEHSLSFRYNFLDARRDQGPHPFVLSPGGTGRGPNENSLPFYKSGYRINNRLNSFALEVNSRFEKYANRFFVSYNRFRDFREPFSEDFPTVQIAQNGVTYTTLGSEPFSIHNILDQDVLQITNNFSLFLGKHVVTVGANFETFSFFNAFNIFRHGVFFLPFGWFPGTSTFSSLQDFFTATSPDSIGRPGFANFRSFVTPPTQPFKGEDIDVGQLAFYAQDEYLVSKDLTLTVGLRVDIPMYFNDMVANPFSRGLTALDETGKSEVVDQSKLPSAALLFSPRVGFNWDVNGDRSTQLRGGTGIFTGRLPFVWVGNVISNPGQNPNMAAHLRSFDLNAADPDFKWPQVWTTNLAVDRLLPWDLLGTLEVIYGKDINAVYVRNADLKAPIRTLPDGRPYYGGAGNNELNPDGGAGIYVIDNTSEGYNYNITAQLRKNFDFGLSAAISYGFLEAKSALKSTEIASVLWTENPVKGNPNKPELSYSEFGNRHRIAGNLLYRTEWSDMFATSFGVFFEIAEGNKFVGAGGNRYSFVYAGDVNGDGSASNDLIYIPRTQSEIIFDPYTDAGGNTVTAAAQWSAFDKFIQQNKYLSANRGSIAERFGAINPWFTNLDLKVLQDIRINIGAKRHTFQISVDILNFANLLNSGWGVRSVASSAATSPLQLTTFDGSGAPHFTFKGNTATTFADDPGLNSRWQVQIGLRYIF